MAYDAECRATRRATRWTAVTRWLALLFWSTAAGAQSLDMGLPEDGDLRATPVWGPDGVIVVVSGFGMSGLLPDQGFHVYRDEGRGFRRLTGPEGLKPAKDERDLVRILGRRRMETLGRQLQLDPARNTEQLLQAFRQREQRLFVWATLEPTLMEGLGVLYRDRDTLPGGSEVRYLATRLDGNGGEIQRGIVSAVTIGVPPMPLLPPLITGVEALDGAARVRWEPAVEDRASLGFHVYRGAGPEGPWQRLDSRLLLLLSQGQGLPVSGSFTDSTAGSGRTWYYSVTGQDFAGNESAYAVGPPYVPQDLGAPPVPEGVRVGSAGEGITLVWPNGPAPDLAGFRLQRRATRSGAGDFADLVTDLLPCALQDSNRFVDRSALPGVEYQYRLLAVDGAGNTSEPTVAFDGLFRNTKALLPPVALQAAPLTGAVRLDWQTGPSATAPDLAGFHVFRSTSVGGDKAQVSPLIPPDTLFFTDRDKALSPEGTYWYTVRTVNLEGVMSADSRPVAAAPQGLVLPEPPRKVKLTQDGEGLRLFWGELADRRIAGFHVYRQPGDAAPETWERLDAGGLDLETTHYLDRTARPGVAYRYMIRSVDTRDNEGVPSAILDGQLFEPAPPAPGNLGVHEENGSLVLQWNTVIGGTLKGYRIYRRREDQGSPQAVGMVESSMHSYRDDGLEPGVRYLYSISSISTTDREGVPSPEVDYLLRP
jgi:hypothetical protein